MIYVIINNSYEAGDLCEYPEIVLITSDKQNALDFWDNYCDGIDKRIDDKWVYQYDLIEYPDGWHKFLSTSNEGVTVLKHIDNLD